MVALRTFLVHRDRLFDKEIIKRAEVDYDTARVNRGLDRPPAASYIRQFWQTCAQLGASSRVLQILREGYALPFHKRPILNRKPLIKIGDAHTPRQVHLMNGLHALLYKEAVEVVLH